MPSWIDVIEDNEIWALAYYVRYLQGFKKTKLRGKHLLIL